LIPIGAAGRTRSPLVCTSAQRRRRAMSRAQTTPRSAIQVRYAGTDERYREVLYGWQMPRLIAPPPFSSACPKIPREREAGTNRGTQRRHCATDHFPGKSAGKKRQGTTNDEAAQRRKGGVRVVPVPRPAPPAPRLPHVQCCSTEGAKHVLSREHDVATPDPSFLLFARYCRS
jgi:hypothetical protein